MPLGNFLKERVKEIATGEMPPLTRAQRKRGFQYGPWQRFHADEDGKISFVSVFTVLAIVLFIGLIMNTTVSIKEKIELQNAADTSAHTSTLWMARSMNAVTTINHLMGEQTALLAIIDGFGGPMLGNEEVEVDESRSLNDALETIRSSESRPEPAATDQSTLGAYLHSLDKPIVNKVYDFMVDDKGKHKGGAALYDSKIRLKQLCEQIFLAKIAVNGGMEAAAALEKSPFAAAGYVLDGICVALHIELSMQLVELAKERKMLDLAESIVEQVNRNRAVFKAVDVLCQTLSIYSDSIVGGKNASKSDRLNRSISETLDTIRTDHRLTKIELIPNLGKIVLPVRAELPATGTERNDQQPDESLGAWEIPGFGWSGNFGKKSMVEKLFEQIAKITKPLKPVIKFLDDMVSWLDSFGKLPIPEEYRGIGKDLPEMLKKIKTLTALLNATALQGRDGSASNPCLGDLIRDEFQLPKFYWKMEQESQWVRATYPYVDDYRSGLLHLMKKHLSRSNMATYYANWTNRYTLANTFLLRKETQSNDSNNDANAFDKLKKKIRDLRREFDDALDSFDEEEAGNLVVAPFERISDDLLNFVKGFSVPPGFQQWKQDVLNHQTKAIEAGNELNAGAEDDITDENLKALGTQVARINLLNDLLTLLEELVEAFEIQPPHMYVMKYMDGKNKGIEPWTSDSKLASKLFCLQATVKRDGQLIFMSPVFYSQHMQGERSAIAQSMLYNANGRSIQSKPDNRFQANTGWDTLNWNRPVKAIEWGKRDPSVHNVSATDIFTKGRKLELNAQSKIHWQSKLVPIAISVGSAKMTEINH